MTDQRHFSPYTVFSRKAWQRLRADVPLPLTDADLKELQGLNEPVSLKEVEEIYLPLSRLLNLYVAGSQHTYQTLHLFLGNLTPKVPYIIGVAGSVAVGKSTFARVLRALLSRWPDHPRVDLVTTDGFLLPNRVLEGRGLMKKKGFPESYDLPRLIRFLYDVKSGRPTVEAPVYSHLVYDIVPGEKKVIRQPDILIIEGLNILQGQGKGPKVSPMMVSDFIDFGIYVDADIADIGRWYVERFHLLRRTAFQKPESYFRRYADLTEEQATHTATRIWREINEPNLKENILPSKGRADLILKKGHGHAVVEIHLRKC